MTDNLSYSKGICWIDDCRIPFVDEGDKEESYRKPLDTIREGFVKTIKPEYKPQGRFPANILVSDDVLNDGVISKSSGGSGEATLGTLGKNGIYNTGWGKDENADGLGGYKDKGTNSRYYDIDKWFDKLLTDVE